MFNVSSQHHCLFIHIRIWSVISPFLGSISRFQLTHFGTLVRDKKHAF